MAASHAVFTSPSSLLRALKSRKRLLVKPFLAGGNHNGASLCEAFLRSPVKLERRCIFTGLRLKPVMEWQDCRKTCKGKTFGRRKQRFFLICLMLQWFSFILWYHFTTTTIDEVLKDKPDLSEWTLAYNFFGREYTFSWLARNLQPIRNQKIHWRSLDGLPNRGAVRFFPRGPSSCMVELTVSYKVPQVLSPLAAALRPFMEGLLQNGLDRFAVQVKDNKSESSKV